MEVGLGVTVFLSQTEVNNIDLVPSLSNTHQEIVGLDVTMNERFGMDVLDSRDQLVGQEENGLEGKFSIAEIEKIFERRTEEIEHHGVVVTLGSKPADERDTDTSGEGLVDSCFIFELRMFGLDGFKFDGDFFTRDDVSAQVDITEGTTANFTTDTVFVANAEIHCSHLGYRQLCRLRGCFDVCGLRISSWEERRVKGGNWWVVVYAFQPAVEKDRRL